MVGKIKNFTYRAIAGANWATILLMFLTGYSDRINPASHPFFACAGMSYAIFLFLNLLFLFFWLTFKWREAWIPVVGFLLCYGPTRKYAPLNLPQQIPKGAIKILSYNVEQFGVSPGVHEAAFQNPVIRYITESDADLVCLQEANGQVADSADVMLRKIYPYSYRVTKDSSGDIVAIYSRFPMIDREIIPYRSRGNLSIACTVHILGRNVLVVNNHLESNKLDPEDKRDFKRLVKGHLINDSAKVESDRLIDKLASAVKIRAPQIDAVASYVARHRHGKSVVVCGDFNDNPISYSLHTMEKDLTNCYVASGNGPGWSYHRSGMYFRIDHILCSDDWAPYGAKVDRRIHNSDHYPLYGWLKRR